MTKSLTTRSVFDILKPALLTLAEHNLPLRDLSQMFNRGYVEAALSLTDGNKCRAANLIRTHRNTIMRWSKLP